MSENIVGSVDPYARQKGEIIAERNTVVPPWAPAIKDFSVTVKQEDLDGEIREIPPGFTIGDVAPEYRWAINPETGVIMSKAEFRQSFERWYAAHYTMRGEQVEGEPLTIPSVKDFVSLKVDPDDITRVVPMTYDPHRPVLSKPRSMYDRDGEVLSAAQIAAIEGRGKADESGAQMKMLVDQLKAGDITQEVYQKRSMELFGASSQRNPCHPRPS
jgi:hypothetical protein